MPDHQITIDFVHNKAKVKLYEGPSTYRSNNSSSDTVVIYNKAITIDLHRASAVQSDTFSKHNSTFHKQIVKALCLYYVLIQEPRQIRQIAISTTRNGTSTVHESLAKPQLKQTVSKSANLAPLDKIDPKRAQRLLEESPAGHAVLNAITHLIKSLDAGSEFDRFERLWRAFNALYRAYAKMNTEHDCHVALRAHIEQNPHLYPLVMKEVTGLSAAVIRSRIKWNQMILNNYATTNKSKALHDNILRVKDHRILEIYQSSLPIRQVHLSAKGFFEGVQHYLDTELATPMQRDSDVVATLCIKYMYFVRNKIAHAERTDHGFAFLHGGAAEEEIQWLAPFLEALVIDLININHIF